MTIYPDNNIFIYLENGNLTVTDLEILIENKIDTIFYSASHIQEALEISGVSEQQKVERINTRLKTIEKFTQNNYIYENLDHEVFKLIESPFEVIETITEVSFGQDAIKGLMNLIGEDQKKEMRKALNIDPGQINNYSPKEAIAHLSQKLSNERQGYTFLEMVELGVSNHPNGNTFGRSNRISGIFELLDMLGYWKDKTTEKSNYARLWDSSHVYYASFCDYFISNDKKTVNKSKVVYDIYNIKTRILMPTLQNIGK